MESCGQATAPPVAVQITMGGPDLLFQSALPLRSALESSESAAQLGFRSALLEDIEGGA